MLESIMSWNWGNIIFVIVLYFFYKGLDISIMKLGDIENRLESIENKLVGIDSIRESVNRIEHNTRP